MNIVEDTHSWSLRLYVTDNSIAKYKKDILDCRYMYFTFIIITTQSEIHWKKIKNKMFLF